MNAGLTRMGPVLALLYGATFWGLVWYPSRQLEALGLQGPWLVMISYAVALLVLFPFVRTPLADLRRQPWELLALLLAAGWTNVAFVMAVLEGQVLRVLLLFYLSPIWTVLLGRWLLGEQFYWRTWLMLALGIGGALVMLWDPAVSRAPLNRADLLAATAGITFALNNVMTRRITSLGVRSKTQVAWVGVVAVSAVVALSVSPQLPSVPPVAWLGAALLGVCGFLLATLLVVYGVSNMPVQRSAVIMLFELIVGAFSAWLLAGEAVSLREWWGGLLIISAAMLAIVQQEGKT